ncbi:PREDICTED: uncharacterized protein LOC109190399 [Ipomoea nil]|uniref:uncharacterized protein LOC109190399 n=1 Tax=Ipomoea nil TaxID=35883 RepID=UPI0009012C3E|nr:PREDICTED: uncharacterized protein LOC109190399 [Ipomoea nil]
METVIHETKHDVRLTVFGEAMVSRLVGDAWLKCHFTVIVVSTLISVMGNGYANQRVFQHFEDVEKIKYLNWCKFLLDCLVNVHAKWIPNKYQPFTGPIVFMTVFYVDRDAHLARVIQRTVPSVRGWTSKLLREREFLEIRAGGFGRVWLRFIRVMIVVCTGRRRPNR